MQDHSFDNQVANEVVHLTLLYAYVPIIDSYVSQQATQGQVLTWVLQ